MTKQTNKQNPRKQLCFFVGFFSQDFIEKDENTVISNTMEW